MKISMTPAIAHAVGMDAGNANMRAAGRSKWNVDDWNAAAAAQHKADPCPAGVPCEFCNPGRGNDGK